MSEYQVKGLRPPLRGSPPRSARAALARLRRRAPCSLRRGGGAPAPAPPPLLRAKVGGNAPGSRGAFLPLRGCSLRAAARPSGGTPPTRARRAPPRPQRYAPLPGGAFVPPLFPPGYCPHRVRPQPAALRLRAAPAPGRVARRLHAASPAPGFKAAPRVRAAALRGGQRPACPCLAPLFAAGSLRGRSPLLPSGFGLRAWRGRRFPLARPLRGFGHVRLLARGQRRQSRRFCGFAPGLSLLRACCARLPGSPCPGAALLGGVLPCALPAPAAPAGGSGRARGCSSRASPLLCGSPWVRSLPSPAPFHCSAVFNPALRRLRRG